MLIRTIKILLFSLTTLSAVATDELTQNKLLETMTWVEAEQAIKSADAVVVPLGAASKQHGLHLPNNTDLLQAIYFRDKVLEKMNVVAAPVIQYSYYPAFVEYPGSISLDLATATSFFVDIARSLSRQGVEKIYFINTGISTAYPLQVAKDQLRREGIYIGYNDLVELAKNSELQDLFEQVRGSHADEKETSMMLYIAPEVVEMTLAQKDDMSDRGGHQRLTLSKESNQGVYSSSGSWGDPTLATYEKGKAYVEERVAFLLADLQQYIDE